MRQSSSETALVRILEALLFAAEEPLSGQELAQGICLAAQLPGGALGLEEVEQLVAELNAELQASERPYRVVRRGERYFLAATPEASQWIERAFSGKARRRLSQAALEVLAIVAYRQPITRAEIESIRGVSSAEVVQALVERGLLTVVGHAAAPGRPALYGTTERFLHLFGLESLQDLPPLEQVEQLWQLELFEPVQAELFEEGLRRLRSGEDAAEEGGAS